MLKNKTNNNFITPVIRDEFSFIETSNTEKLLPKTIMFSTPKNKGETMLSRFNAVNFIDNYNKAK